jgi:hypothetical protein
MRNVAEEFGRRLAAQQMEKQATAGQWWTAFKHDPAVTAQQFMRAKPGASLGALGALGLGAGLGTKAIVQSKAEKDPELADRAKERGRVAGALAGASVPLGALFGLSSALGLRRAGDLPVSHLRGGKAVREALKYDAGGGAAAGFLTGMGLSGLGRIPGTLDKKWKPVSSELDKDDIAEYQKSMWNPFHTPKFKDPEFMQRLQEQPPGALKQMAIPLAGAAAGAVLHPAIKHGPTAVRAFVSALKNHLANKKARTGAPPFVNMGYKGFLP